MDERIQKYFNEELNVTERLTFLRQVEADEDLKSEFIAYQNARALLNLSPETINKEEGREGYERFMLRLKKHTMRSLLLRSTKYAAAVIFIIGVTVLITNQFISPSLPVAEMNTLFVPAGQRAQITLQDGTNVWLNAQTTLTYPSHFYSKERKVSIIGEGFFEVTHDKKKPFIVSTPDAEITVLGTKFNVYSYPDAGFIRTSLIEGSVKVAAENDLAGSIILKPNEEAILKDGIISVSKIASSDAFLWKDGIYSFDNERLEDIVKKLELYYDVKIIIDTPSLADVRYTCKFRQRDGIDEILQIIRRIHKFKIEKDKDKNVIRLS